MELPSHVLAPSDATEPWGEAPHKPSRKNICESNPSNGISIERHLTPLTVVRFTGKHLLVCVDDDDAFREAVSDIAAFVSETGAQNAPWTRDGQIIEFTCHPHTPVLPHWTSASMLSGGSSVTIAYNAYVKGKKLVLRANRVTLI